MIEQILNRLAEQRRWRLGWLVGPAPGDKLVVHRLGASLALLAPTFGARFAHGVLHIVERLEGGDRHRRAHVERVERLHEVATRVHAAPDLDALPEAKGRVEEVRRVRDDVAFALRQHLLGPALSRSLTAL